MFPGAPANRWPPTLYPPHRRIAKQLFWVAIRRVLTPGFAIVSNVPQNTLSDDVLSHNFCLKAKNKNVSPKKVALEVSRSIPPTPMAVGVAARPQTKLFAGVCDGLKTRVFTKAFRSSDRAQGQNFNF